MSKYLNSGKVRTRNQKMIDDVVRELRFVPNEFICSSKIQQSHATGVVIPEIGNQLITSIITTVEDLLRSYNYTVILSDCRIDTKRKRIRFPF